VAAGSAAEAAGIRLGDVLLALDGRIVRNGHDLQTITSAEGASEIALEVASAGGRIRALVPRGELGIVTRPERIRPDQSD
jgi:S1-C subfamily serine protease